MMPTKWYAEIYDTRFKIYNVLQRRKRQIHEATWSREAFHDFHPHDLEHDGEAPGLKPPSGVKLHSVDAIHIYIHTCTVFV